jgi:hypothetical protein
MTSKSSIVLNPDLEYSFPEFNSKVKFTVVMEEVLFTLLTFFFLSGDPKLTNVVNDLIDILGHTPKTIGSVLKFFDEIDLLSYYQDGRYKTIELHLENEFLKSILARYFGLVDYTKIKCKKLKRVLIGLYPIDDNEKITAMFRAETQRLDDLIHEHRYLFDWTHKIEEIERLAKTTNSTEGFPDENPILLFIDEIITEMKYKQTFQTHDLTSQEIEKIVSEVVEEFKEIPPWSDDAKEGVYRPWIISEDEK